MILNLTFLSFWLAPTIWVKEQREMVTSDATSRLHIQCHQQRSVDWEEKVIPAVSRSSFWDTAKFSAICLGLLTKTRRELMSSLVSLSGDLWKWCSASGTTQALASLDGSLSGGQVLDVSCFYNQSKVASVLVGWLFSTAFIILHGVVGGCWLSGGSAGCGRQGTQKPDFSYWFKFIWSS